MVSQVLMANLIHALKSYLYHDYSQNILFTTQSSNLQSQSVYKFVTELTVLAGFLIN